MDKSNHTYFILYSLVLIFFFEYILLIIFNNYRGRAQDREEVEEAEESEEELEDNRLTVE